MINYSRAFLLSYTPKPIIDLTYYARDNITNYDSITTLPSSDAKYINSVIISDMTNTFRGCSSLT